MKRFRILLFLTIVCLSLVEGTLAQTTTATALPRLMRFGGTVRDPDGNPLTGAAGITFALYSEQTGGAALWMETQNVTADSSGHYTVLLGSTKPEGLPAELFNSEQARWVGVQVQGQAEQPRVLLVSAPYALKAGDAETIGGLPPSAFVLAAPPAAGSATASSALAIAAGSRDVSPATATDVTTTGGTANSLPLFTGTSTILDSVVYQSGTGSTAMIGINTSAPTATLDVQGNVAASGAITTGSGSTFSGLTLPALGTATASGGWISHSLDLAASSYDSATGAAVSQTFKWQAEPLGNDTANPGGSLNLLFYSGTNSPVETGLKVASSGQISFAAGQTFPGTGAGTVTSVGSGTGLTGGPITGSGTLGLASNACAAGDALTALPFTCAPFATLGANTFTGNQIVAGNVTATGSIATGAGSSLAGLTLPALGAATSSQGRISHSLDLAATSYNSATAASVNQTFKWQAEPQGNDTANPGASLNLLFYSGTNSPAETGLKLASNGQITFAPGQTFPGASPAGAAGVNPQQVALLKWFPAYQSASFPVGEQPSGVAFDGSNIWVTNSDDTITELLASTGAVLGTFSVGIEPAGIAYDGANIWAANISGSNVIKLQAATGTVVGTFPVGSEPIGVAFDGANIWVANFGSNNVTELQAATGAVLGTFPVGSNPIALAFDGANIWVANSGSNNVTELQAATGAVVGTFNVGSIPRAVAFDGANIWVTNNGSNTVSKLLASTGAVVGTFPVGTSPYGVAFDGANIWVANFGSNNVTKLLAATGAVVGTFPVGTPFGIAFDGANIWVANWGSRSVSKL
ncbi:MAG: YncE family protein [Bryobacteraceae bacterium]